MAIIIQDSIAYRKKAFKELFSEEDISNLISIYNGTRGKRLCSRPPYYKHLIISQLIELARCNIRFAARLANYLFGLAQKNNSTSVNNIRQPIHQRTIEEMDKLTANETANLLSLLFRYHFALAIQTYGNATDWKLYNDSCLSKDFFFFNEGYDFVFHYANEINARLIEQPHNKVTVSEIEGILHFLDRGSKINGLNVRDYLNSISTLYFKYNENKLKTVLLTKRAYSPLEAAFISESKKTDLAVQFLEKLANYYFIPLKKHINPRPNSAYDDLISSNTQQTILSKSSPVFSQNHRKRNTSCSPKVVGIQYSTNQQAEVELMQLQLDIQEEQWFTIKL